MDTNNYVFFMVRIFSGTVFLYSWMQKVRNSYSIRESIDDYNIFPRRISAMVGYLLLFIEIAISACLIIGVAVQYAAIAAALLLLCFSLAMAVNIKRGRFIDCHCSGKSNSPISSILIFRNVSLSLLLISFAIYSYHERLILANRLVGDFQKIENRGEILPMIFMLLIAWCAFFLLGGLSRIFHYLDIEGR